MSDEDARAVQAALNTFATYRLQAGDLRAMQLALAAADAARAYWCPDCGVTGTHLATCAFFPGEPVVHGNRTPPPQPADGKRMVDLNAVIETLDDVASKVLPGSDPTACVRAAAGVIERKFGGPAPSEEKIR